MAPRVHFGAPNRPAGGLCLSRIRCSRFPGGTEANLLCVPGPIPRRACFRLASKRGATGTSVSSDERETAPVPHSTPLLLPGFQVARLPHGRRGTAHLFQPCGVVQPRRGVVQLRRGVHYTSLRAGTPVRPPRSPMKRRLKLLSILVLAALALLAAAEVAVRAFRPQPAFYAYPGLYVVDPLVGHRMKPGLRGVLGNLAEFTTQVRINSARHPRPRGRSARGPACGACWCSATPSPSASASRSRRPSRRRSPPSSPAAASPRRGSTPASAATACPTRCAWFEQLRPGAPPGRHRPRHLHRQRPPGRRAGPAARPSCSHGELLDEAELHRSALFHWLYQHSQLFALSSTRIPQSIDRPLRRALHMPEPGAIRGLREEMALYDPRNRPAAERGGAALGGGDPPAPRSDPRRSHRRRGHPPPLEAPGGRAPSGAGRCASSVSRPRPPTAPCRTRSSPACWRAAACRSLDLTPPFSDGSSAAGGALLPRGSALHRRRPRGGRRPHGRLPVEPPAAGRIDSPPPAAEARRTSS